MGNVFLVEDESKVAAFVSKGLEENGYHVTVAGEGASAKKIIDTDGFDIIILDVMLPDMSGIELCRQFRKAGINIPILILTALDNVNNKVKGLQAGADDYLVKPFHFSELLARMEALMRRFKRSQTDEQVISLGDLNLDTWSKTAERAGVQITLTAKEYTLLELFMRHPNKTLSREYIAEKVWSIEFDTGTNFIDVYVNYLRKKIEKGFSSKLIYTIIGMGYIMKDA